VAGIADQREIQLLFGAKACQRFFGIAAGANQTYTQLVEVLLCVTKLGRFCRSTGSVRFWKEEKNDAPAFVGMQRQFAAFVRLQREIRCFVANL
jgi:hypothetical protein